MKSAIHPTWYNDAKVTCACGNTFTTGSTLAELQVDICSKCHPFFTGEMRFVDRQGRVDKFMQKMQKAQANQGPQLRKSAKNLKKDATSPEAQTDPKSYQELLREQQSALRKATKTKTAA